MDLIYRFLKACLFPIMRIFYRRVYVSNRKNIPNNKPILIASNHPNSFLDGVSISYYLFRKTFVLVRGDVFKKAWANFLLRSMRLLPIFRSTDGNDPKKNLQNNNQTFDECYALFKKNYAIIIFSEAIAKLEKRLRPIKKGTARLAFDAMEKSNWQMDLQIVVTSLNYTHFKGFRNELMIDFSEPIRVQSYKAAYLENSTNAIISLTNEIESRLKAEVAICEDPANDEAFDFFCDVNRNEVQKPFFGYWFTSSYPVRQERKAAAFFNKNMADPKLSSGFSTQISHYRQQLNKLGMRDKAIKNNLGLWWKIPFVLLFTLPATLGMVLTFLPYAIASNRAPKMIKRDEFYDSILVGLCLVLGILYTFVLLLIGFLTIGIHTLWVLVGFKALSILALFVWEAWQDIILNVQKRLITAAKPAAMQELKHLRSKLLVEHG